jgi:hypothetical protein
VTIEYFAIVDRIVAFSVLPKTGSYIIVVPQRGYLYTFKINPQFKSQSAVVWYERYDRN